MEFVDKILRRRDIPVPKPLSAEEVRAKEEASKRVDIMGQLKGEMLKFRERAAKVYDDPNKDVLLNRDLVVEIPKGVRGPQEEAIELCHYVVINPASTPEEYVCPVFWNVRSHCRVMVAADGKMHKMSGGGSFRNRYREVQRGFGLERLSVSDREGNQPPLHPILAKEENLRKDGVTLGLFLHQRGPIELAIGMGGYYITEDRSFLYYNVYSFSDYGNSRLRDEYKVVKPDQQTLQTFLTQLRENLNRPSVLPTGEPVPSLVSEKPPQNI